MQADTQTPASKSSNPSVRPAVHQGRPTCALCQRQYLGPKSACLEYQGQRSEGTLRHKSESEQKRRIMAILAAKIVSMVGLGLVTWLVRIFPSTNSKHITFITIPDICRFFLHEQNFWRIKFTPKKRVNYDKIHSKLPIFCVITQNTQ